MIAWKSIGPAAAAALGLALAAPAHAASGMDAATLALRHCLAVMSNGQYPDPIPPGSLQPPPAGDQVGQQLVKSGDPVFSVPSANGQVYVVLPKGQCVADSFGIGPSTTLAERVGPILTGAPYNGQNKGPATVLSTVRYWAIQNAGGEIDVIFGDTDQGRRIIMIVSRAGK